MKGLLLHWLISAASLLIVAYLVPGFRVASVGTALIAAIVLGLINGTIGVVVKLITLPFRILTLGLLTVVINAVLLMLAAQLVSGFSVGSFGVAVVGSIALWLVSTVLTMFIPKDHN